MSEFPQQADPDLHAIFGIDGEPDGGTERVISVERAQRGEHDVGVEGRAEVRVDVDPEAISASGLELDPLPGADVEFDTLGNAEPYDESPPAGRSAQAVPTPSPDQQSGLTKPSRRGSSQRFLTDVIVDMGLASRKQVEDALESSRISGTTP